MTPTPSAPTAQFVAVLAEQAARAAGPGVHVRLTTRGTELRLEYISVDRGHRGVGRGEAALTGLLTVLDAHGTPVTLEVDPVFGSDVRRLAVWYTRHGFVPTPGEPRLVMRRLPLPRMV